MALIALLFSLPLPPRRVFEDDDDDLFRIAEDGVVACARTPKSALISSA